MKKNRYNAFSFVSFSMLISIIAIILLTIIIAHKIILNGKIDAIIMESFVYKKAINNFYNRYHCIPGDCSNLASHEEFVEFGNILEQCNTIGDPNLSVIGNNKINVPAKRTCAFWELKASGLIDYDFNINENDVSISQSITGITMPAIRQNSHLSWQLITIGKDDAGNHSLPIEVSSRKSKLQVDEYRNKLSLVIVQSNKDIQINLSNSNWPAFLNLQDNKSIGGLSVKEAHMIDIKIDTGMPYVGDLISGRDMMDLKEGLSDEIGCTKVEGSFSITKIYNNLKYNLNNINEKCIMSFVMAEFK